MTAAEQTFAAANHCYSLCLKQLNSHEVTAIPSCIYTRKLQLSQSVQRFLFTSYAFCLYLDYSILIYDHNIRNNQMCLAKYYLAHHVVKQCYKLTKAATSQSQFLKSPVNSNIVVKISNKL